MATPITPPYIINPSFETGDTTGWSVNVGSLVGYSVDSTPSNSSSGNNSLRFYRTGGGSSYENTTFQATQSRALPVYPGMTLQASCDVKPSGERDEVGGFCSISFYNDDNSQSLFTRGNSVEVHLGQSYRKAVHSYVVPAWATKAYIGGGGWLVRSNGVVHLDNFETNYSWNRTATLVSPPDGSSYNTGDLTPLGVTIGGTGPDVSKVEYYRDDGVDPPVLIHTATSPNYSYNAILPDGDWDIYAVVTFTDSTEVTTGTSSITVGTEVEPTTREFRASNSLTYLVMENFAGLASAVPATARVNGVQFTVDYLLNVLARVKDAGNSDVTNANFNAAFDSVDGGSIELVLLSKTDSGYATVGTPVVVRIPIARDDFTLGETGTSEGKRWGVFAHTTGKTVTIGGEDTFWGQSPMDMVNFSNMAFGLRFYPNPGTKPSYADSGDAVHRIQLDRVRASVYFDAGSVDYYFASPDKESIIKGTLAAAYVLEGDLRTGDASGVMQLTPTLDIVEGTQTYIGDDWTVHSSLPPTDANQIAEVGTVDADQELGMEYNGLPTQHQVEENRSRYQFITENFYGDPNLNSLYGVHGLPRAFAYNGDYFYKIYTQADPEKDNPRSVANHHGHLALGFHGGRVDISVAGEPYNYNGVDGASSWAFGDKVVGLLPLSGTILGVFGSKGIWGISGTTVDNFATQVISPNIGAIEYTIADMGFPVYANAYGIYTLNQTQQYGDYLGQPMSKDISPWIRPRLLRRATSDKDVVCAWPVRSKNQYRLAFKDGYITSMTLNGQAAPTFSLQKYFVSDDTTPAVDCEYSAEYSTGYEGATVLTFDTYPGLGTIYIAPIDAVEGQTPEWFARLNYVGHNVSDNRYELVDWGWDIPDFSTFVGQIRLASGVGEGGPYDYFGCASVNMGDSGDEVCEDTSFLYEQESIVPAAVSSELDDAGEERIHIAPYVPVTPYEVA